MPRPNPGVLLRTAARYLKHHPEEVVRALRNALGLRVGIPLDALRYAVTEFVTGSKAPKDVTLEAVPPGLRLGATVDAMGTILRVQMTVTIIDLVLNGREALVTTRINGMALEVLGGGDTPVSALIKSGALDLSKPGNLVAYIPKRPPMLVDAKDDRIVIDLLKVPSVAKNPKARRALSIVTPVLTVASLRTRDDHLDVQFRARPTGISEALGATKG